MRSLSCSTSIWKQLGATAVFALMLALAAFGGCGGGGSGGPTGTDDDDDPQLGEHFITAKIDGATWVSEFGSENGGVPLVIPGLYSVVGITLGASDGYTLSISLANIGGTGDYPLGVGPSVPGGSVLLSNASDGWSSPQSGADGLITITAISDSSITGTFNVTLTPFSGGASGTKTLTDGSFNLRVNPFGNVGPLPDNRGSKVRAMIGGSEWNAATVAATLSGSPGIFSLAASNNTRNLSIVLADVNGPGLYPLSPNSPTRQIGVTNVMNPTANFWTSLTDTLNGSVTITDITATRIRGTYEATLSPAPGSSTTGSLSVLNGTFDVGRP
ncbi:MAG: DUF6252 family protein [bacterium]